MITLPPDPPPIVGRATVIDGDTLEIRGQRIRIWGIDAPESRQTCQRAGQTYRCGQESALALAAYIDRAGGTVTCIPRGRPDRYRRVVAMCDVRVRRPGGQGTSNEDLGAQQVQSGHALDYPRYSSGEYASYELMARERRAGLWAGTFVSPWEWRGGRR